ncbi:response regulator [Magnetospirillum fulvum]|jgi:two-component system chemotaxis response regulator CheY|uniref:Two-component system, chemotaxis family, response regulator CheY n=1 Tax=Magnetospirillum fulvum TaxID=1082 RepID=A0A1H6HA78_MAGFU|nr:response regulator [Magnetospirillum fulvum]SEH32729.1 two-component system, chemotaxis family, response regulator CheY [Magnetospirillum fulvum]
MTAALDRLKVLIIDDQDFVRAIIRKMLGQIGIASVVEARDGSSGLDVTERERPDLVICDVRMRPLDGFGFVRSLRAHPDNAAIPVILLTAHTDEATLALAEDIGVDAFLAKPVLAPALKDKIVQVIATRG